MPKQKTRKGVKKRFRVTAKGKVKHRKANRGHLKSGKAPKRKRQHRVDGVYEGTYAAKLIEALRPSL
jgi:large subunit ribosomal protein L35